MGRPARLGVAALTMPLVPQVALAGPALLQTVDLNDKGMSTEGGVAKLYGMTNSKFGRCKIEVVHFGEMGKTTYRFLFDGKLRYAAMREYRYSEPIYAAADVQVTLKRTVYLTSKEGATSLPQDFVTYRNFFDSGRLQQCSKLR